MLWVDFVVIWGGCDVRLLYWCLWVTGALWVGFRLVGLTRIARTSGFLGCRSFVGGFAVCCLVAFRVRRGTDLCGSSCDFRFGCACGCVFVDICGLGVLWFCWVGDVVCSDWFYWFHVFTGCSLVDLCFGLL